MLTHSEQGLNDLKSKLMTMASHAESSVRGALHAVIERDDDTANKVKTDDATLDQFEKDIDEMAVALLTRGPLVSDLRLIMVATKISHDLERVADEATTIARRAIELNKEPQLKAYVDIPRMAAIALEMLNAALDAFVNRDPAKARGIIPRDKEVDALNKQLHRELAGFMAQNRETISRALNLMVVSKSLERIADHATNIAEEIVYLYEGRDIRHMGKPFVPRDPSFAQ